MQTFHLMPISFKLTEFTYVYAMATDKASPPEGFDTAPDTEQDVETIELKPGDVLLGTVTDTLEGEGEFGPWIRLTIMDDERGLVRWFAKGDAKTLYYNDDLKTGKEVWVHKDEDTDTYNGTEYNPVHARVKSD